MKIIEVKTDRYELYQGDCLEVMDKLIEKSIKIDMILTDIPYGTTQCKWDSIIPFDLMWERINKINKENGCIALFGSEPFSSQLRCSNIKNYKYDWKWDKVTGTGHLCAKFQPMQKVEDIMIFGKGKFTYNPQMIKLSDEDYKKKIAKISKKESYDSISQLTNSKQELSIQDRNVEAYNYKYPDNILTYSKYMKECNNSHRLHPTQKPVDLLEYLILTYTNEGDTVLDFTMGSGSTGIACMNANRKFIGIELDETYFNISKERIQH